MSQSTTSYVGEYSHECKLAPVTSECRNAVFLNHLRWLSHLEIAHGIGNFGTCWSGCAGIHGVRQTDKSA